jgi:hypothetical protein
MAETADDVTHTCSQCQHWLQQPIDPTDLGAPRAGSCTESLHVISIPVQQGRTVVPAVQILYPTVPGEFPACGRFKAKALEVV